MNKDRKVILYIATSLDGYIAQPDDDLSFLDIVQKEGEDYGYVNFMNEIDTIVVGRKTFDWVMNQVSEFAPAPIITYVITKTPQPSKKNILFYNNKLDELIERLKNEPGKNIFINGGAQLVAELLKSKLIDEIILSIIPILVGNGIKLFDDGRPEQRLELVSSQNFESGLVQIHYKVKKQHN